MNRILIIMSGLLALQADGVAAERIEQQREWTERFEVADARPTLEIHNIWGDVLVSPGPDGEISVSVREHRSAPSQDLFDRSLEVYGLDIQADEAGLLMQVGESRQGWHGRKPCHACRVEYRFDVRAPIDTRVFVSTVNDGRLEVSEIRGTVTADNVNGPVTIRHATACERVESVNGDVSLGFAAAPESDCRLETINGDILLQLPAGSGIDLAVDLNNGRFRSEVPVDPLAIPARVEHRLTDAGHHYRIEQAAGVRLAGGGPVFSVSSLNGDLRITESSQ